MNDSNLNDPYVQKATLTSDGKPWTQRCYVCLKAINFLKDASISFVRVPPYVRHKKCYPGMPK